MNLDTIRAAGRRGTSDRITAALAYAHDVRAHFDALADDATITRLAHALHTAAHEHGQGIPCGPCRREAAALWRDRSGRPDTPRISLRIDATGELARRYPRTAETNTAPHTEDTPA